MPLYGLQAHVELMFSTLFCRKVNLVVQFQYDFLNEAGPRSGIDFSESAAVTEILKFTVRLSALSYSYCGLTFEP